MANSDKTNKKTTKDESVENNSQVVKRIIKSTTTDTAERVAPQAPIKGAIEQGPSNNAPKIIRIKKTTTEEAPKKPEPIVGAIEQGPSSDAPKFIRIKKAEPTEATQEAPEAPKAETEAKPVEATETKPAVKKPTQDAVERPVVKTPVAEAPKPATKPAAQATSDGQTQAPKQAAPAQKPVSPATAKPATPSAKPVAPVIVKPATPTRGPVIVRRAVDAPAQPTRPQGFRPGGPRPNGPRPMGGQGGFNKDRQDRGDRPAPQGRFSGEHRAPRSEAPAMETPDIGRRDYGNRQKDVEKSTKRDSRRDTMRPQGGGQVKEKYHDERRLMGNFEEDSAYEVEIGGRVGGGKARKEKSVFKDYKPANQQIISVLTNVKLPAAMTVKEFAEMIKKSSAEVIKKLMLMGMMSTQNQVIDFDTAALIADEFGIKAEQEVVVTVEERLFDDDEGDDEGAVERPPVVVVMGHVDHGKTSLLDAIRKTSVTSSEAGGITQAIGAYMVRLGDRKITFLDTPGHEAFTAMRARGAQVTDVAILVVAADDGVMPQTVEAINHAKAAGVPIVVAVNKIDKEGANIDRVKTELAEKEVVCEDWGGDVPFVPVSAKTGANIEELLETVLLSADILQLKANPDRQARGTVIEAKLDKNRGPVATLLVQRGTLKAGDTIVSGTTMGRVRTMTDDKGRTIKKAGPSTPVEITGLTDVPEAGEVFHAVEDERLARELIEKRKEEARAKALQPTSKVSLETLNSFIEAGKMKDLNIIVKADVVGSVEAVKQSLQKLSTDEVRINIIHGAVGAITESDVTLADVSNAIIIGFNVRPGANISEHAKNANVEMKLYRVIYDAIDDIKSAIAGMLAPKFKEVIHGHAEIRQTFKVSGVGTIGGAMVTDGTIVRNSSVRIVRDGIVIFEGKLASLKRFKDDAKEVASGYECGLSFENYNDIKEGDQVECYTMDEVKPDETK